MWIKICGITNLADALHAAKSGANALGFIFAPSPRRVTPESIGRVAVRLPQNVERYGVFTDADFDTIIATVNSARLTGVQLHAHGDAGLLPRLREHFTQLSGAPAISITSVLQYGPDLAREIEAAIGAKAVPDVLIVDTRTEHARGGTGISFDWKGAREVFLQYGSRVHLIVAGGLTPNNVEEAIMTLEAWGVDVSSGVEAAPGRKDPALVYAFIQRARHACARLEAWGAPPPSNR